jgi:hypothetical protein
VASFGSGTKGGWRGSELLVDLVYRAEGFILDCANAWIIRNREIVPRSTAFSQRVFMLKELEKGSSATPGQWYHDSTRVISMFSIAFHDWI